MDLFTKQVTEMMPMKIERLYAKVVVVGDYVFVIGGLDRNNEYLQVVERCVI